MKKFQNTSDNVITITTNLSKEMRLNKNDSSASHSRSRKKNYLFRRNKEQSTEPIDGTLPKKSTPHARDDEVKRQTSRISQKRNTSAHQKPQLSREKKKSSDSEDEPGQIDETKSNSENETTTSTSAEPTSPGSCLKSYKLMTRSDSPLNKGLISDGSTNPTFPRNISRTSQRESANNVSNENGNKSKVPNDSMLPRSKSRLSRKVANNSTDSDRALPRNTSRVSEKVSNENSVTAEPPSRTSVDDTSATRKSRKVSANDSTINSDDLASAKNNSQIVRSKSRNNSEKQTVSRASFTKNSRTSIDELANKSTNKVERNSSKKLSKTRSRSESINNSNKRRLEANNLQNQQTPATSESASPSSPANNESSSSEPVINNPQTPNQNTDSNTAANNEQSNLANTNQPTLSPNENQQSAAPAATGDQPNTTNDTTSSTQNTHDDERFTSPTDRQLNPERDIQQSSRETRTQPIPPDPNSVNAAKHDLEAWLQSTSHRETNRPRKPPINRPYPKFPVIRPCDRDITSDPEDCKKKLEQKLERMYTLKQAYYADPEDNIPFINLGYTKEGIFVDEPIEKAFIYDDAFLKPNRNSPNPDSTQVSSEPRSNQSKSAFFSPVWLNSKSNTASSLISNQKHAKKESSHSKWMDKIFEEAEINMIENVLHDCQHKFNKLAASVRTISSSSETSSASKPIHRSRKRIIIPHRSPYSNK